MTATLRVKCQVCGRALVPLKDGTHRQHRPTRSYVFEAGTCKGSGYRAELWPLGQRLQHYAGTVWRVVAHKYGRYGQDYLMECERGVAWDDGKPGQRRTMHAEYMHRHGWEALA